VQVIQTAAALMVRSMVLSAQSAGQQRLSLLQRSVAAGEEAGEVARLRDENRRLTSELRMLKDRLGDAPARKRYSPLQRLQILWHMAYYRIPRSRVKEHFLIAKSTLYRWLHAAEEGDLGDQKTKKESRRVPECQPASEIDPPSASITDPPRVRPIGSQRSLDASSWRSGLCLQWVKVRSRLPRQVGHCCTPTNRAGNGLCVSASRRITSYALTVHLG